MYVCIDISRTIILVYRSTTEQWHGTRLDLRNPCDSILEATLTVSPNKQYLGILLPTTPATTEPSTEQAITVIVRCDSILVTVVSALDCKRSGGGHTKACQGICPGRNTSTLAVKSGNNIILYKDILTAFVNATNDLSTPCHEHRTGAATV